MDVQGRLTVTRSVSYLTAQYLHQIGEGSDSGFVAESASVDAPMEGLIFDKIVHLSDDDNAMAGP